MCGISSKILRTEISDLEFHSWSHAEMLLQGGGSPHCTKPLAPALRHSHYFLASLRWLASSHSLDPPALGPIHSG